MDELLLTADELEAAKRYLRVDGNEDDHTVTSCVLAARGYLEQAGVSLPEAGSLRRATYDLVAHSIALSYYDQRDTAIVGANVSDNPALSRALVQLKLTEPPGPSPSTDEEGG